MDQGSRDISRDITGLFLPAAKIAGHRTVKVVLILEEKLFEGQLFPQGQPNQSYIISFSPHYLFSLGLDLLRRFSRIPFKVGFMTPGPISHWDGI